MWEDVAPNLDFYFDFGALSFMLPLAQSLDFSSHLQSQRS